MDYLEQFRKLAAPRCAPFHKTITDLQSQLPKVTRRLEAEKGNRDNLEGRLKKLEELSMECLSDQNSYEKYKVSMKKLSADLAVSQEIIENISTKILPAAEGRLRDAESNLKIILGQVVLECRKTADGAINELLRQCLIEYDGFLAAAGQLFIDYGESFFCSDESFCPSPWNAAEIGDMKVRLGMTPTVEKTREEVWANYNQKATEPVRTDRREAAPPATETVQEPTDSIEPDTPPTPAVPLVDDSVWGESDCFVEREVG